VNALAPLLAAWLLDVGPNCNGLCLLSYAVGLGMVLFVLIAGLFFIIGIMKQ
jgi:hypothetical protein